MRDVKQKKKAIKMLFFAAIFLTAATTVAIIISIQNQNQNTYPLINTYIQGFSQGFPAVIREKMDISSNYTFTGNVYETINVMADNIVIDGKGYTVQGSGSESGFNLNSRKNVTIKDVIVTGFQYGFYLYYSSNNTLSNNTANNNDVNGFYLVSSSNNTLSNNTANSNYRGFYLEFSSYNTLSGNTVTYNYEGFKLWHSSYNIITGNTIVDFWGNGFRLESSYNNTLENNTVIATGLPLLRSLLYDSYISFYTYQQSIPSVSNFVIVGLLVTLVAVVFVCSVVLYGRRKGVVADKGVWKLPRDAFLAGTVGGIIGAIMAAIGIMWSFIVCNFLKEIQVYVFELEVYLNSAFHGQSFPYPISFYPSAYLFGVSSFILSIFLIMTAVLIGIGFYGTYKVGGGAMGLVSLIFGIVGITLGALLIIMGNLTTGYTVAQLFMGEGDTSMAVPILPVPVPNFPVIWIGSVILGFTFIILGSASISVRKMITNPSASVAAGILSIIGAVVFIGWFIISIGNASSLIPLPSVFEVYPVNLIIGFGLVLVAFILWSVIFYSSRNM